MQHPYESFVHTVEHPARYLGGEWNSIRKDPASVDVQIALAFPDLYDIGMSHLGTKILYSLLNKDPRFLAERAFAPWSDMEAELRARNLPVVTLESGRPLSAFDVVGFSLQYELTYTNVLLLLELGGIPLRSAERGEDAPLVIAGGPTATHPEPLADFIDAFLIGEAEGVLRESLADWKKWRDEGCSRKEALIRLAARGHWYVPSLYTTALDAQSGFEVVTGTVDPRVPRTVLRAWVENLDAFPFPDDSPIPYAEAVFDRFAIEIARGCTEGCRFCQAGMIYRPVRERDPRDVVSTVLSSLDKGGHDEVSLTSLSTADYSCVTPLVQKVMSELRPRKVSVSVSSLRAYGLSEDLLDEIASVRAGGLTFAPEAGTQRMRDVITKNVTEEDIEKSATNAFSRGFGRLKLYFMIGLPTETDDDVRAIAQLGGRTQRIGRRITRHSSVTVSVSTHVPKPHTPFQWCAMDTLGEIERKQRVLRDVAYPERVTLKHHDARSSLVEGVFARGDRRVGRALELAYRRGARFDGWDETFDFLRWMEVFRDAGIDPGAFLGTIPVEVRLPWDHIDIGLEPGFLVDEYRKALKDKLSPPCGKPFGKLLHHTNEAEALADGRRLVCYDCGIACDLGEMKEERLVFLRGMGALTPGAVKQHAAPDRERPLPTATFQQGAGVRYRLRYTKLGRAAFLSHLDMARHLGRALRRAGLEVNYTKGFHPKPDFSFGPALGLGFPSLGEFVDLRVAQALDGDELAARLTAVAPEGLVFEARRLADGEPAVARLISLADFALSLPLDEAAAQAACAAVMARDTLPSERGEGKERRAVDVRRFLVGLEPLGGADLVRARLEWQDDGQTLILLRVRAGSDGSARPAEIGRALLAAAGLPLETPVRVARLRLRGEQAGALVDPMQPPAPVAAPEAPAAPPQLVAAEVTP